MRALQHAMPRCAPALAWVLLPSLLLALFLALVLSEAQAQSTSRRVALVVGNAAYADSPLRSPVNDARAMEAKLKQLGFAVTKVENLQRAQIGRTVNGFASSIRPGDEVVVFYAGHGLQVKGVNYLPAVDADIHTEEDVPLNSLNLNTLLDRLEEAKAGVKLLFLDACRNNPYARSFRSSARGLARVQDAPSGTLMHFATRPGSVAADGSGVNGLYTAELIKVIDQPGVPIEQMLKRVATNVERASQGQQEPWVEGSLKGDFYFKPGNSGGGFNPNANVVPEPVKPPQLPSQTGGLSLDDLKKEEAARQQWSQWQTRMKADFDAAAGFSGSADLQAKAWDRFLAGWSQDNPYSQEDETLRQQAQQRRDQAQARVREEAQRLAQPSPIPQPTHAQSGNTPVFTVHGVSFRMQNIPAGNFMMGSPASERER
ncbi:MAG: caspase domain-containing protein, partial [Burkholderiales bacterium]